MTNGGAVREGPGRAELPADVRARTGSYDRDAALMEAVLDALPSPTVLLDPDGLLVLGNTAWSRRAATYDDPRIQHGVGSSYYDNLLGLWDDEVSRGLVQSLRELSRGERDEVSLDYSITHPSGSGTRWYHVHASRVDQAGHVVVTHADISSRVQAEQAATWRARHDHLTELPNRAHLLELIDAELQRPDGRPVSVLVLDVDGFKDVNDSLGHDVGDELLRELAGRLVACTRANDTVGRMGGDEFVVLCRDCDTDGAEALAHRFQSKFVRPFDLGGRPARLTGSIGISTAQGSSAPLIRSTELVRDADLAMYAAKAAARNGIRVFTPDLREAVQRKVRVAAELREALGTDQLLLHYQPVVHLPTGEVEGVEALIRWQHPDGGMVPPGDFIPVAEQYELIDPLTRWVLGAATRQAAEWGRAGVPLVVGVNVSATTLASGTLVDDVAEALASSGLPPEQLIVELTETSVAEDPERAAAQFAALRISGVEVSIDDFGTGFSSLGQLVNIPAGVLKIDRSLVAGAAGRRSQSAAAIAAVVGLAGACGMRSLAEGVETAEQLALATELGCTFAQGYHIARPMPADELLGWLKMRPVLGAQDRLGRSTGRLLTTGQ
jgi:diguanylate cyclase (GGDEF)-like protein